MLSLQAGGALSLVPLGSHCGDGAPHSRPPATEDQPEDVPGLTRPPWFDLCNGCSTVAGQESTGAFREELPGRCPCAQEGSEQRDLPPRRASPRGRGHHLNYAAQSMFGT